MKPLGRRPAGNGLRYVPVHARRPHPGAGRLDSSARRRARTARRAESGICDHLGWRWGALFLLDELAGTSDKSPSKPQPSLSNGEFELYVYK